MGVIVHVVDATIQGDSERFNRFSTRGADDVVIRIGSACRGIVQAAADARRATSTNTIDALVFYGHGAPGAQGVSMGKDPRGVKEGAAITSEALDDPAFAAHLAALTPHFTSKGVIVLRGCNTAEGPAGAELIKKLARIAGVPVKSSDWFQIVGRSDLSGNIVTATPDGSVTEDTLQGLKNLGGLPPGEGILLLGVEMGDRLLRAIGLKK